MIRRILHVERRGAYEGWEWPEPAQLRQTTVIYGSNGSGKSTLARLLADAAAGEAGDTGLRLDVVDDASGEAREVAVTDRADPVWAQIRVFNPQYVERHLRFDADDVG